jgi:dTDP-4-dehydrorhamnose reductase
VRVLVTGAAGLLGGALVREGHMRGMETVGLTRAQLDITDRAAVADTLSRSSPDVVVNCAAFTGVDQAEEEPAEAFLVNRDGAGIVASGAAAVGARVVHLSTDFVFDGRRRLPYGPEAEPGPLCVYGQSKLAGEKAVHEVDGLVVRTSWLYAATGRNFVTTILRRGSRGGPLKVVDDQTGSPTWVDDAAAAILDLAERGVRGVWHVAGAGEATWLQLAVEALRIRGLDVPVTPVSSDAWGAAATRPRYSVLDVSGTEVLLGRRLPHWREALKRCLEHAARP